MPDDVDRERRLADHAAGGTAAGLADELAADAALGAVLATSIALDRALRTVARGRIDIDAVMRALPALAARTDRAMLVESGAPTTSAERRLADRVAGVRSAASQDDLTATLEIDGGLRRTLAISTATDRVLRAAAHGCIEIDTVMRALPAAPAAGHERPLTMSGRVLRALGTQPGRGRRRGQARPRAALPGLRVLPAAAAAALLVIGVVALLHARPQPAPAVLVGSRSAVWAPAHLGDGIFELRSGLAEISFRSGARIILEGPATLEALTPMRARLHSGRLVAHVPEGAHGFKLETATAEVVDLGTEFGIAVTDANHAEVQVFAGRVVTGLSPAAGGLEAARLTLVAGRAARLDATTASVVRVPAVLARFVREMDTDRLDLDLSDIIAGGDGRGNGSADGIDPRDGRIVSAPALGTTVGDNRYHRTASPFVDGVFIPDGYHGPTVISSGGHWLQFPVTSGSGYDLIRNGGTLEHAEFGGSPENPRIPPVFGSCDFGEFGHTALGMHANAGFTVDLAALSRFHHGLKATRLTGMVANIGRKKSNTGDADFWVILDGRILLHQDHMYPSDRPLNLDLWIPDDSRFLTLVSTDAGDGVTLDWLSLGDARLRMAAVPEGP